MSWRPFVRVTLASRPGDRHWWSALEGGYRVHQWLAVQTVENVDGALIFQFIAGPILICLAAKQPTSHGAGVSE